MIVVMFYPIKIIPVTPQEIVLMIVKPWIMLSIWLVLLAETVTIWTH